MGEAAGRPSGALMGELGSDEDSLGNVEGMGVIGSGLLVFGSWIWNSKGLQSGMLGLRTGLPTAAEARRRIAAWAPIWF